MRGYRPRVPPRRGPSPYRLCGRLKARQSCCETRQVACSAAPTRGVASMMRLRGIHYDVGTETIEGSSTRPTLTVDQLERDIDDIRRGLHANGVRITGGDVARLAAAIDGAARHE